jgi:hypothetical protein
MAALALGIASMGLTAAGTYKNYQAQRQAARDTKALAAMDAELTELEAKSIEAQSTDALERGRQAESRHRFDLSRLKGAQRAALAAQGIDIESGSAGALQVETAILGEVDAQTLRNNAWRESMGFVRQAELVRRGGKMNQANYRNQVRNYRNQSASTLLTGAAQLGAQGYDLWSSRRGMKVPVTPRPPRPEDGAR